jgi:hypothetical protein
MRGGSAPALPCVLLTPVGARLGDEPASHLSLGGVAWSMAEVSRITYVCGSASMRLGGHTAPPRVVVK